MVSPARRIAFEVLRRVEAEGAYAGELLYALLGSRAQDARRGDAARAQSLKREDAALATELTLGVLRWQRLLDAILQRRLETRVDRLDLEVRLALRLGLYQLLYLSRVPARAAVNESVELVKGAKKHSAAGLVNAVLRRVCVEGIQLAGADGSPKAISEQSTPVDVIVPEVALLAERLGILQSHPTWLVERWLSRLGESRTRKLLEANNAAQRVTCICRDPAMHEQAAESLRHAGLVVEPPNYLRAAWNVRGGTPAETEAFRRGWISIQDEASHMTALLLEVQAGQSVLDLCAAPGGKTTALARAAGAEALVVAGDRHLHRLSAMKAQRDRVGVRHAHLVNLDATQPLPLARRFDRILVDVPCSGTGTLSRNPEIRWRLRAEDLVDLHRRQAAMLANALQVLAPGGRLVYSTCSLEAEENEQVVAEVLACNADVRLVSNAEALGRHLVAGVSAASFFDAEGFFRTLPGEHRTDGFFAAVLERGGP